MLSEPLITPAALGANLTVTVILWVGAKLVATAPDSTMYWPVTAQLVMPIAALPVFVMERICDAVEPTFTVPKSMAVELADSVPEVIVLDGAAPRPQPASIRKERLAIRTKRRYVGIRHT